MEINTIMLELFVGLVLGILGTWLFYKSKLRHLEEKIKGEYSPQLATLDERLNAKAQELLSTQERLRQSELALKENESRLTDTIVAQKALETELAGEKKHSEEKAQELLSTQERLRQSENALKENESRLSDTIVAQKTLETELAEEKKHSDERLNAKTQELTSTQERLSQSENALKENESRLSDTIVAQKTLETELAEEKKHSDEKLKMLTDAKEQMKTEFQNLANTILEDKSKKFTDHNKAQMETLLNPLKDKITTFEKQVSDTYDKDSKERLTLTKEIENLRELNQHISEDANNLTKALTGQAKTQGTWGEIILERVLEMSGLRKGEEYEVQEGFHNEEGKLFKPDVIVHLPEGKDVVVDSKMSLTAYERFHSAESEDEKSQFLKEHITSIRNHINTLSVKKYEDLKGIQSLNYVLMFIPIESAFLLAFEQDRDLYRMAFDKNIIIVSPSTLLATLRTIQSLWQHEYQNRNAQKIADDAGKLYDKFVAFVEELEKVGNRIKQAQEAYDATFKHLSSGRGNLIKRADDLKILGIKNKKSLPGELGASNENAGK